MIIDKYIRMFTLLQQMRSAPLGSATRATYADRILPKYLHTECPQGKGREYLAREIAREQKKAA